MEVTVASVSDSLKVDKPEAWRLLKALEALGVATRGPRKPAAGGKGAGGNTYLLSDGWIAALSARLGELR
jgi:predicted transcriptional regulator